MCVRFLQFEVGDGTTPQARDAPVDEATAERGFPHAATPNASPSSNGQLLVTCSSIQALDVDMVSQEAELQSRRDQFQLEELRQSQLLEKRQLPKHLKLEHKQKVSEARKALRNKKGDREALRVLDEQYVQKCQTETDFMTEKHEKDMETLKLELDTNMKELHEIQVKEDVWGRK